MLVVREETDRIAWDEYVTAHPASTPYHLWLWKGVVEDVFRHRTAYLAARDGESIVGVLPLVVMRSALFGRFVVSMPFVTGGGILARDPETERSLAAAAEGFARRQDAAFIEYRHHTYREFLEPTRTHKVTLVLKLAADEDQQWRQFDAKLRNHIRKGQKLGVTVRAGGIEELDAFYYAFAKNMRDLGTPVYPRGLFQSVVGDFGSSARVLIARLGNAITGGAVAIRFRDTLEVPWASSLREYRPSCANSCLYWEAVRLALREGARRFDFGRSSIGDGSYQFKIQWGAKPVPLYWQYWLASGAGPPNFDPNAAKYRTATALWRRMPLFLASRLGPRIVRFIP